MDEEEAKRLVRDAIAAGVFNDLGSGSNIDLCVIKKGSVNYLRGYEYANAKGVRTVSLILTRIRHQSLNFIIFFFFVFRFSFQLNYDFPVGTTTVLETKVHDFVIEETVTPIPSGSVQMETD